MDDSVYELQTCLPMPCETSVESIVKISDCLQIFVQESLMMNLGESSHSKPDSAVPFDPLQHAF